MRRRGCSFSRNFKLPLVAAGVEVEAKVARPTRRAGHSATMPAGGCRTSVGRRSTGQQVRRIRLRTAKAGAIEAIMYSWWWWWAMRMVGWLIGGSGGIV